MSLCDLIGHTQYHVFATEHHQLNQWLFSQSYVTLLCRTVALYIVYTIKSFVDGHLLFCMLKDG